jgi:hypothetical protein
VAGGQISVVADGENSATAPALLSTNTSTYSDKRQEIAKLKLKAGV